MRISDVRQPTSIFCFQAEDGIRDLTVTGVQTCALPISSLLFKTCCAMARNCQPVKVVTREEIQITAAIARKYGEENRSEEHTSELQSQSNIVCRLLLEKKKASTDRTRYESAVTLHSLIR